MQGLMRISDFQRRRILQLIKHFRVASTARRTLARAFSARRAAASSVDAGSPLHVTASMPEPSTLPSVPEVPLSLPVGVATLLSPCERAVSLQHALHAPAPPLNIVNGTIWHRPRDLLIN